MTAILTRDQVRTAAPSVFATTPWEGMSESYRFIPTAEVLDLLEDQGFRVTTARQSRTRIPGKADFTRHMLRLRHESFIGTEGEVPEVVLFNSHDRSSAYKLYTGVLRFACQNGLVVQAADFGSFSIRHSGSRDLFAQVREATARIMEEVPAIMNRIDAWKQIILPRSVQLDFAREAAELKPNPSIPYSWLLTARREEDMTLPDASRDLYRTLNCVQESLLRGGLTGRNERGRKVTTRPVKAVDADLKINRKLWLLAENYANN
jgi:hypothetical protein